MSSIQPTNPKGTKMDSETVVITPERAIELLKLNGGNRRYRQRQAEKYAADMRAGRWHQDVQPIVIDWNGVLRNGQHRLNALILSGTQQTFILVTNVDPKDADTIDCGLSRSTSDVLGYNGYDNGYLRAATIGWLICIGESTWEQALAYPKHRAVSTTEILESTENDWFNLAVDELGAQKVRCLSGMVTPSVVMAFAITVSRQAGFDAVRWFFDRVSDGAQLPSDNPIAQLRTQSLLLRDRSKRMTVQPVAVAMLVKAWNYWVQGRAIKQLRVAFANGERLQAPIADKAMIDAALLRVQGFPFRGTR